MRASPFPRHPSMTVHGPRQPLVRWLSFLIFFAVLNETVFNVSTPTIAAEFGLSAATVSWVMTIFMVFFGIGSVVYGRLADLYSLRRLIEFGTCLYCAASVLGFVVQDSYALVVLARAVQAMGASRSEEHTSELQSRENLACRPL